MNAGTKLAALNKFRNANSVIMRQPTTKVLVIYDVQVKSPEVSHVPLIVNYGRPFRILILALYSIHCFWTDLPKAVEEYAHRLVLFLLIYEFFSTFGLAYHLPLPPIIRVLASLSTL